MRRCERECHRDEKPLQLKTTEDNEEDNNEAPDLIDTDDEDNNDTAHPKAPSEKTNMVTEEEEEAWEDAQEYMDMHPSVKAATATGDDPMGA